jgi:hypothetical protein
MGSHGKEFLVLGLEAIRKFFGWVKPLPPPRPTNRQISRVRITIPYLISVVRLFSLLLLGSTKCDSFLNSEQFRREQNEF